DFIGLAGPNGAGKTTLIKVILGLLPITKGEIELFSTQQAKFSDWKKIGYLPQKATTVNPLFPATVEEIVALGLLSEKTMPKRIVKNDKKKVEAILEELGISDLKKKILSELSGGQQQKVFLARALVSSPEILIFDEPSTALDPESRESFFKLIEKLNKEKGIAIILITHDTSYIGKYANKFLYVDKELIYFGKFSDFCQSAKMNSYFGEYEQHIICHQHD
ncbi:metal ABC transporter ATP-binding protein, partial [Patescibacteria group bacterium]|nr:metal ABC transporter ATP-binding protein [Patescibacteria group bacterium]